MVCQIGSQLYVELSETIHRDGNGHGIEAGNPNRCISRVLGALAILTSRVCDDGHNSEDRTNETVLKNPNIHDLKGVSLLSFAAECYPKYIEPCKSTFGPSQSALVLAAGELLQPAQRPCPVPWRDVSDVDFLLVQTWCNIVAH